MKAKTLVVEDLVVSQIVPGVEGFYGIGPEQLGPTGIEPGLRTLTVRVNDGLGNVTSTSRRLYVTAWWIMNWNPNY